jgi:hypothetical protein
MRHPEKLFLTWESGTVTVSAIAPIITGHIGQDQLSIYHLTSQTSAYRFCCIPKGGSAEG